MGLELLAKEGGWLTADPHPPEAVLVGGGGAGSVVGLL